MTKNMKKPRRSAPQTRKPTSTKRHTSWWSWLGIGVPAIALAAVMMIGGGQDSTAEEGIGSSAPEFSLPATDGSIQALDGILAEGDVLLYFSMGPGCDGCFHQIPEIDEALAEQGIILVPVMVDPAAQVAAEAQRFGIDTPILIDSDRSVSEAYDMIGVYGHQGRPSHSFALVNQDREITWVQHYAEMFVPLENLLADIGDAA